MFLTTGLLNQACNCIGDAKVEDKKLNCSARSQLGLITGDAFLFLTTLVIGILGILGIIPGIPPAAAYSLIAISGAVLLSWIIAIILTKGRFLSDAKNLLKTAFSSDPKL